LTDSLYFKVYEGGGASDDFLFALTTKIIIRLRMAAKKHQTEMRYLGKKYATINEAIIATASSFV
jgi:hypothetical protein